MREGWKSVHLADVCTFKPPKKEARQRLNPDDAVSFVPMNNLKVRMKSLELNEERPLGKVAGSYTYFADGDVLLAKITPCFDNGKLGIASGLTNGVGFGSSEFIVMRPNEELDAEYLFYFLSQDSVRDAGARVMSGAVGHKRVPKEFVEALKLKLPSLTEQKGIVAILDEAFAGIDTAIANTEKNLVNAREIFESALDRAFALSRGGPDLVSLGELVDVTHGFAYKGKEFSSGMDVSYPIVLTPGNYSPLGKLVFNEKNTKRFSGEVDKRYLFSKGDLTVVMTDLSSKMKILGKPALVERDDVLHNQRIGRVLFKSDSLEKKYLYYFLRSEISSSALKKTATGTMVKHTAPKRILGLCIPLPETRDEQKAVVHHLDVLEADVINLEGIYNKKLAALAELKQSLLQKAFSGELTAERAERAEVAVEEATA